MNAASTPILDVMIVFIGRAVRIGHVGKTTVTNNAYDLLLLL